jgi:hypothetical protein
LQRVAGDNSVLFPEKICRDFFNRYIGEKNFIDLQEFTFKAEIFANFLEFLYTDRASISLKNAEEMKNIANCFGMTRLVQICNNKLSSSVKKVDPPSLASELQKQLHHPFLSDIQFEVEGNIIYGHKVFKSI